MEWDTDRYRCIRYKLVYILKIVFGIYTRLKNVYLSDTRISLTLKNLSVDNECKCKILCLIYPYTSLAIYIHTELAPKLTATASAAQSVERWSRYPGSRVQFPA